MVSLRGTSESKAELLTPFIARVLPLGGAMVCAYSLRAPVVPDCLFVAGFLNLPRSGGETVAVDGQCGPAVDREDSS